MSTVPQPTADDLRQAALAAEQTPAPQPTETVIDGIKYGKTAEGKHYAELPTGSRYLGDNEQQLAINIAKGKVEADNTLKRWKDEHPAQPAQTPAQPAQPAVDPTIAQAREYLLNEIAQGIGLNNGDEFKQYVGMVGTVTQNQINQDVAMGFQNLCPDFPESDANNEVLLDIAEQSGFPFTPQGLRAAHLIAVAEKKYEPLTADQIRAQRMNAVGLTPETVMPKTPAPMIPSTSPAGNATPEINPFDRSVPLDKVREWANRM